MLHEYEQLSTNYFSSVLLKLLIIMHEIIYGEPTTRDQSTHFSTCEYYRVSNNNRYNRSIKIIIMFIIMISLILIYTEYKTRSDTVYVFIKCSAQYYRLYVQLKFMGNRSPDSSSLINIILKQFIHTAKKYYKY